MLNPMTTAFVTDIHVTNGLQEPITVTPVGTVGAEGRRAPLPVYCSRFPAIPSRRAGGFAVEPGQTRTILYDWDDINLSEIVIGLADGTSRQLPVDPEPTKNQHRQPTTNRFVIDSMTELEVVPANVALAAAQAQQPGRTWLILLPLLLPWLPFYGLLKAYRRSQATSASANARHPPEDSP